MLKRKIFKPIMLIALSLLLICQTVILNDTSKNKDGDSTVAVAETKESSVFDGILKLVSEKGADLIKDNLPTVGDFLCSKVFDYIGIDYTDSYTKELKEVNEKLDKIQSDLQTIIKNQQRGESQNTIDSFFNVVDTFSTTIHPLYAGYNTLMRQEKENTLTKEQVQNQEAQLYENLDKIVFGNGTSTGDLYLQLTTLLGKITEPSRTINKTLMEHYVITYEHRWAFDTQSFAPKKEFLGYVSTSAMEGLMLYTFKHLQGMTINENNVSQQAILETRWADVKSKSELAFAYLQNEIKAVEKAEKASKDTNTVTHYSTGKKLSKELYVSKAFPASNENHYTYTSSHSTTRQGNMRTVRVYALNNASFVEIIQREFTTYKANYSKPNATMKDFLQSADFTCSDWNHSLYGKQRMKHEGSSMTNEYYKFYISYVSVDGNSLSETYWGQLKYKVFGSPTPVYDGNKKDWSYIAFVAPNGVLLGSYDEIYSDNGNTTVDAIYRMFRGSRGSVPENMGKVW